jgi:hypothetical protein
LGEIWCFGRIILAVVGRGLLWSAFLTALLAATSLPLVVADQRAGGDSTRASARASAVPRTPEGRPSLEGVWVNNSATPLERPAAFKGRARLSDEEVADLKRRAARIFAPGSDFAIGDIFYQALIANPEEYKNPEAVIGIEWLDDLVIENRSSLITDPADGRLPALTPAGRQRQAATAARQSVRDEARSLSNILRCISQGRRGWEAMRPASMVISRSSRPATMSWFWPR